MASRLGYASPYDHGYTGCRTEIATGTTNGGIYGKRSQGIRRALCAGQVLDFASPPAARFGM